MRGDWYISLNVKQNHHIEVKSDRKQVQPTFFELMEKLQVLYRTIRLCVVTRLRHCVTSRKVAGSILDGVINTILPAPLWPGVDSASKRNEYQEYFLWGGGGWAEGPPPVGLITLLSSCADYLEVCEPHPSGTLLPA
jgi:hypothetical protein